MRYRSVKDLDIHRFPVRIVCLPAVTVVRLARYEMHAAHVAEEILVRIGRLVGESGMRVGRSRYRVIYRLHPLVDKTVLIAEHRSRKHDHLRDDPVDLPVNAQELISVYYLNK